MRLLPPGPGAWVRSLLRDPQIVRYLQGHGLSTQRLGTRLRMGTHDLCEALDRALLALDEAPASIRRHPLLASEQAHELLEVLGGFPVEGFEPTVLVIPDHAPASRLRVVQTPSMELPDLRQVLGDMAAQTAVELLQVVDQMLEELAPPKEVLRDTLVPLLESEVTCELAARILGRADVRDAADALEHTLRRTSVLKNRLAILGSLMRLGHRAKALRTLRSILIHGSESACAPTVDTLVEVAEPEDAPRIHDMLRLVHVQERMILGALLYRLGDTRGYVAVAVGLRRLGPRSPGALVGRILDGIRAAASKRFVPLVEQYARRETRAWYRGRAIQLAGWLKVHGTKEDPPERILELAEQASQIEDREHAYSLLDDLLRLEPDDARGLYLRASMLKEDDRLEEALEATTQALGSDSSNWRLQRLRGSLLWDVGRPDAALEAYDRALQHHPTDSYAWYYKGYVLYHLKRHDEALPCLDRALTLKPDAPWVLNQKAFCLERMDRHDEACTVYRRSLRQRPADLQTREYLAQALHAAGKSDQALQVLDSVLRVSPRRESALNERANLLYDLERWSAGATAYAAYLEHRPDSYNAWFNRGLCLRFLGTYEPAAACFRKALDLRPDSLNAKRQLEHCLTR